MMQRKLSRPVARIDGLVTKSLGDEILVYDLERDRAHSLNSVAAAVWDRCNGQYDAATLADQLRGDGHSVTEESVRYALGQLSRARLLTDRFEGGLTRRDVIGRLGTAALFALPVVASIVAPTAAQAQSLLCLNAGDPCIVANQCCGEGCGGSPANRTCGCHPEGPNNSLICVD